MAALTRTRCTAAPPPCAATLHMHRRRHRRSLRSFTPLPHLSRMNDEPQPTNHTEACAKDLVRHGPYTGPVNGIEADGTAKQAKSKQKSEKEALKAAADKADMAAHKVDTADKADNAVSLAAPAEAIKA
eukprot:scaffold23943_cov70-Phaeocystis_antarctica.AAC.1